VKDLLDRIKDRCVIDAEGCWLWAGGTEGGGYPVMLVNKKKKRVRSLVFKGDVKGGYIGVRCGYRNCVNPKHIVPVPRGSAPGPVTRSRITETRRKQATKLSMEKAREIRKLFDANVTQLEIAKRYGVSHQLIHKVVYQEAWRESSPWGV
jgi:hypothetical protein